MATKIPFKRGEMIRAWLQNIAASQFEPRNNAHRLLLFYAVECGLKAVIMTRENLTRTDQPRKKGYNVDDFGHDINLLLDELRVGAKIRLKPTKIKTIKSLQSRGKKDEERAVSLEKSTKCGVMVVNPWIFLMKILKKNC
jgi:hypothetical protein